MDNANAHLPVKLLEQKLKGVMIRLPIVVGNEAINFALDNFRNQGFLGNSFVKWPARKKITRWGQRLKRPGRALLVDSGRLRRSLRIVSLDTGTVTVGTDVPYARAHNEGSRLGLIQTVRSHSRKITKVGVVKKTTFKKKTNIKWGRVDTGGTIVVKSYKRRINQHIPARRFLGYSPYLTAALKRVVNLQIMKTLR
jgi:phage gpG-like protein